ncbi:MAG: APC family permease, partial [Acidobacteria bacterium]|nr:APC family permease [Acidobacteriota bacterium]
MKSAEGLAAAADTGVSPSRPARQKVSLFPFIFVMYAYNTAGPFGLEDQVRTSGPGMALLYQLVIPFFWCIPISLVAAELTSAMPVEGGFYRWSRAAFGDFWGFLAGWWNWCASFLLGGAYSVLFADYLTSYFPNLSPIEHYLLALSSVALIVYLNLRGIRLVGNMATALELSILAIIAVLCAMSVRMWHQNPFVPLVPPHQPVFQVFGVGFALGLWLYAGYEQLSSVAEEVEDPQRNYLKALFWVVPLSMATYFLPTFSALAALGNWQRWHDGYFVEAARLIGGPWLGLAMTLAGAAMSLSILNAMVLSTTRMPFAMAEDGYLFSALGKSHPKFGTPFLAILVSAPVYCLLAWHSLAHLISVYIWLRISTSILTVLSAWQLRRKRPELDRAFRIPWGKKGLAYAVIAPLLMSGIAMIASDKFALKWGPVALV